MRFLVEPGAAADKLRDGFLLIQADKDQSLHPALRGVLKTQPEFASWTPSTLCLYYVEAVAAVGRRFAERGGRKSQLLGVWSLATVERATGRRRDLALEFFAGRSQLPRAAERAHVRLREVESAVSQVPETSDSQYRVKIGKTSLVWKGRAVGDSAKVAQPIEEDLRVNGTSGTMWDLHFLLKPAWSRDGVGMLSVEGKDALAKALKASPIRFVGPLFLGGGGELRFSR